MKTLLALALLAAPAVAACACDPAPSGSCAGCCDPKPEENCPKAVKYLQDAENSGAQDESVPKAELLPEAPLSVREAPFSLPCPEDLSRGSPGPRNHVPAPLLE